MRLCFQENVILEDEKAQSLEFINAIRKTFRNSSYIYENNMSCEAVGENMSIGQADQDKVDT